MLAKFFSWEIFLFTTTDFSWAGFVIVGLLLGIVLRLMAVRRRDEFKDTFVGLLIIWFLLHIVNYVAIEGICVLVMSIVSCLAPVSTFALISFLLVHMIKKVEGDA